MAGRSVIAAADPYIAQKLWAIALTVALMLFTSAFLVPVGAAFRSERLARLIARTQNPAKVARLTAQKARIDTLSALSPLQVLMGADRRLSTSKTVVYLWTFIVAYILIALIFVWPADWAKALAHLDGTYLTLLASSPAAALVAKTAVTTRIRDGSLQMPPGDGTAHLSDLFGDASQQPDVFDIQYVAFNLIAMAFVLTAFAKATLDGFPVIPVQLVTLTAAPSAVYAANKVAGKNKPSILSVAPARLAVNDVITIYGTNFMPANPSGAPGGAGGTVQVLIGGVLANVVANSATDTSVQATVVGADAFNTATSVTVITATGQAAFLAGAVTVTN